MTTRAASNTGVSVIIPVLNDARALEVTLSSVPDDAEVIVVDGGSEDDSVAVATTLGARVVSSERGRARQMNAGAAEATRPLLLFLHADTRLPRRVARSVTAFEASGRLWARFDVRLSGGHPMFRVIEFMMNWRSRITGICTGDQAILVRRDMFDGFADIPLMEDIEFSVRMRKRERPLCIHERVTTSSRRWEERGIWATILLMWQLRLRYFLGASPGSLAARYR